VSPSYDDSDQVDEAEHTSCFPGRPRSVHVAQKPGLTSPHRVAPITCGAAFAMSIHTTENGGTSFDNTAWEIVFGGNVLRTPYANVQTQFTLGSYDRFSNLEHVHFLSLGLGVQL
jgi:hypothetical protein